MTFFRRIFLNSWFLVVIYRSGLCQKSFLHLTSPTVLAGVLGKSKSAEKMQKLNCNFSILKIGVGLPCFRTNFQKRILNSDRIQLTGLEKISLRSHICCHPQALKFQWKLSFLKKNIWKKKINFETSQSFIIYPIVVTVIYHTYHIQGLQSFRSVKSIFEHPKDKNCQ